MLVQFPMFWKPRRAEVDLCEDHSRTSAAVQLGIAPYFQFTNTFSMI